MTLAQVIVDDRHSPNIVNHHEDILSLAKRGKMNYEIAKELGLEKLEVNNYMNKHDIKTERLLTLQEIADANGIDEPVEKVNKNMTLKQWYAYWYQTFCKDTIQTVTRAKYRIIFAHICSHEIGELKISRITRADTQKYLNWFGATRSKTTVFDHLGTLKRCISDAKEDGFIDSNPFVNVKAVFKEQKYDVKQQKKMREQKKWLEMEEYTKLKYHLLFSLEADYKKEPIEAARGKNLNGATAFHQVIHTGIFIALKTGARFSEILGLTRDDILQETSELNIDKTWDYKYGTGFKQTKNIASIRKVFMDKETMTLLSKYLQWLDEFEVKTEQNSLFIQEHVNPYSSTYNKRLQLILESLDIEPITMHKLRHTHASILLAKQVPAQLVAKRLGHRDTNMLRKVYGHLLQETEEEGNRMIASLL